MSVSGCETIAVNSGIKLEIRKQSASAPREWQMKGWKKERQRRQQLRKEARKRKQISHDLNIWCDRMKQAALQTAYHNIWLNNTGKGDEH